VVDARDILATRSRGEAIWKKKARPVGVGYKLVKDEMPTWDENSDVGSAAQGRCVVGLELLAEMPSASASPGAGGVRNNCKDV
jgi:hypothetical protein